MRLLLAILLAAAALSAQAQPQPFVPAKPHVQVGKAQAIAVGKSPAQPAKTVKPPFQPFKPPFQQIFVSPAPPATGGLRIVIRPKSNAPPRVGDTIEYIILVTNVADRTLETVAIRQAVTNLAPTIRFAACLETNCTAPPSPGGAIQFLQNVPAGATAEIIVSAEVESGPAVRVVVTSLGKGIGPNTAMWGARTLQDVPPPPPTQVTTNPPAAYPPVAVPPVTKPPVYYPPVTHPPVAYPPVAKPPVTYPPVAYPPVAKPPVTHPPVTNPPVANPPVANPPVTAPPATNQAPTNQAATNQTGVYGPPPAAAPHIDVATSVTPGGPYRTGQRVSISFGVQNDGAGDARRLNIDHSFQSLRDLKITAKCGDLVCPPTTLRSGEQVEIDVEGVVEEGAKSFADTITISSAGQPSQAATAGAGVTFDVWLIAALAGAGVLALGGGIGVAQWAHRVQQRIWRRTITVATAFDPDGPAGSGAIPEAAPALSVVATLEDGTAAPSGPIDIRRMP